MIRPEKIPSFWTLVEAIHDKYIVTEDTLRLDAEMMMEVQKQLHASLFEVRKGWKFGGLFKVDWIECTQVEPTAHTGIEI